MPGLGRGIPRGEEDVYAGLRQGQAPRPGRHGSSLLRNWEGVDMIGAL